MRSTAQYSAFAASLFTAAFALDGIVVPSNVSAGQQFQATFENGNSDQYRVFLSAATAGVNGPMCYLQNSTSLNSPIDLTIPASVGPDASYYSIGISDLTSSQGATFSNRFNFTGGSGEPTEYEQHLGGAPFWDANDLPCSAMSCARKCAQDSYPNDLNDDSAYQTMRTCILACPGVTADATSSRAAHATGSSTGSMRTATASGALVTLGPGLVVTAIETVITSGGKTMTEAIVGNRTIELGSAATISSKTVSLGSSGIVAGTTTVPFSNVIQTQTVTASGGDSGSATSASAASATSSAAASKDQVVLGLTGLAGLAALFL